MSVAWSPKALEMEEKRVMAQPHHLSCHFLPEVQKLGLTHVSPSSPLAPQVKRRRGSFNLLLLSTWGALIYTRVSLCGFCTKEIRSICTLYFGNLKKDSSLF